MHNDTRTSPESATLAPGSPAIDKTDRINVIGRAGQILASYTIEEREQFVADRKQRCRQRRAQRLATFHNVDPWNPMFRDKDGRLMVWIKILADDFAGGLSRIKTMSGRRYDSRTRLWAVPQSEWEAKRGAGCMEAFPMQVYHDYDCDLHRARYSGTCTKGCAKHWQK